MLPRFKGKTAVVFGSPIFYKHSADKDRKKMQEELTRRLHDALVDLKKWYEAGAKGCPP
jgi:hypothetical protein